MRLLAFLLLFSTSCFATDCYVKDGGKQLVCGDDEIKMLSGGRISVNGVKYRKTYIGRGRDKYVGGGNTIIVEDNGVYVNGRKHRCYSFGKRIRCLDN